MCKVRGATNGNCEKESAGGKKESAGGKKDMFFLN